jgi:hypothetical protein
MLPATSQARQVPVQDSSQQTPSTQKPDSHCVREVHFCRWTAPLGGMASSFGGGVFRAADPNPVLRWAAGSDCGAPRGVAATRGDRQQ